MRDFDKIIKSIVLLMALFAILLFSGGIWEIKAVNDNLVRMNKISGATDFAYEGEWHQIKQGK